MTNQIVWVDIPVGDLDRARQFYGAVLGQDIKREEFGGMAMALLPHADSSVSGCLYRSDTDQPAKTGPLIYLNCSGRLDEAVAAVEPNGGQILQPKHQIGPYGWRAIVIDSEGNRIALHSA